MIEVPSLERSSTDSVPFVMGSITVNELGDRAEIPIYYINSEPVMYSSIDLFSCDLHLK